MLQNLSDFHYTRTFFSRRAARRLADATFAYQYAPTPQGFHRTDTSDRHSLSYCMLDRLPCRTSAGFLCG